MKNKISVFIFLILSIISINTFSQNDKLGYLDFEGKVVSSNKALVGAVIEIMDGASKVKTVTSKMFGNFKVRLKFNKNYTLKISKEGMVGKNIQVNTTVKENSFAYAFEFEISLFKYVDGLDTRNIKEPVTRIKFNETNKEFDFDIAYTQKMKTKVAAIYAKQQTLENKEYTTLITAADKELKAKNYEKAIQLYDKAIDADPFSDYPDTQIVKCEKLIKEKANEDKNGDKNAKYAATIKLANEQFDKAEYEKAIPLYEEAMVYNSFSDFADKRINECELRIDNLADSDRNYNKAISSGNKNISKKSYVTAKTNFEDALAIKPNEQMPKDKLAEIAKLMGNELANNDKAKLDADYENEIKLADASLKSKKYETAKAGYNKALKIKSAEKYPKDKITEIDKLLLALANNSKKDQEYKSLIANADKLFNAEKLNESKTKYNSALDLKPTEKHPKNRINLIDEKLAIIASANQVHKKYLALIKSGDKKLADKTYEAAKIDYQAALKIKAKEVHPKRMIAVCDKAMATLAGEEENNKKYAALIEKGKNEFTNSKWEQAKISFTTAKNIKPTEQYPKIKLKEIEGKLLAAADKKQLDKNYERTLLEADAYLKSKKYANAKTSYEKAIALKDSEQYPKDKLKEVDGLLLAAAGVAQKEKEYLALIDSGDKLFVNKKYQESKDKYTSALTIKPVEKHPKNKIKELDIILGEIATKDKQEQDYQNLIKAGDESLASKDYVNAKTKYTDALKIKSTQTYPKNKLAEIDKAMAALANQKENDAKYAELVKKADASFSSSNWAEAKLSYTSANNIKPSEQYPKDKLKEVDAKLLVAANKKEIDDNYNKVIAAADAQLKTKNYSGAKENYTKASALKNSEQYPKDKLKEVDGLLLAAAGVAQKEKEYLALIDSGDKLFANKKYQESKDKYTSALTIKPVEKHPKNRIKELDIILSEIATKDKQEQDYQNLIKAGDESLASKDYVNAKTKYTDAFKLKPTQTYPKNKLAEIDKAMAALATQKENDAKYAELVKKADASFSSSNWTEAKLSYTSANNIKPSEQYPKDKLKEVDAKLLVAANKKEIDDNYNKVIAAADAQLKTKDYNGAKENYTKASALKNSEQYPKDKLKEVDGLLLAAAGVAQKEKEYLALIDSGDQLFSKKKYTESKTKYNSALALKSSEQYPKDKITEIDTKLKEIADNEAKEKEYENLIASGDKMLAKKDYENAKLKFTDASDLKPGETYPKNKIIEIDGKLLVLEEMALKDEQYNDLISSGDSKFKSGKYNEAKLEYQTALQMKQSEQYPKDRIAEADEKLAYIQNKKSIDAKYKKALATADVFFTAKKYADASKNYKKAMELKPEETYPKGKYDESEVFVAEAIQKAKEDKEYKLQIRKAESLLTDKKYTEARAEFVIASEMKPDKKLPQDKIDSIDLTVSVLAANKKKREEADAKYKSIISKADGLLNSKKYEEAKIYYSKASSLKKKEQYPKDKIAEIKAILAKQKAVAESKKTKEDKKIVAASTAPAPKLQDLKFANAAEKRKYLSSLATKYPDRKTVEKYTESNGKEIKRIIMNNEGIAHEYREVKQPWGAKYYFKDGNSISKSIFYGETK